jgi:hypothetical protein
MFHGTLQEHYCVQEHLKYRTFCHCPLEVYDQFTVLTHHWNFPMNTLGNDLKRLLRERSLKLWEHLLLAGVKLKLKIWLHTPAFWF